YEPEVRSAGSDTKAETPTPSYSLDAEAKRRRGRKRRRKKSPGRRPTELKFADAERTEDIYPDGVRHAECRLVRERAVWRLEDGRAVRVGYRIFAAPGGKEPRIAGVTPRCEYGLEILVVLAFLVYIIGISLDKACAVLSFFCQLPLAKSQADALLRQLAQHWQHEFDVLCTLLANSLVVHSDETSWSINSVWAFLSEKARLLFFGVHKDAETLEQILDPRTFAGLMISDDAAVYANFSQSQKCWAHLLRKAIKLTLQAPDNAEYRAFADRLLEIYRAACRVQRDGRLGDAGRTRKVAGLDDEILDLCGSHWFANLPSTEGPENDYRLLTGELMRLMLARQLFTFVTAAPVAAPQGDPKPVAGTNNEAERTLRSAAQARKTGRTSKTFRGARRQTILSSVLESLRQQLPKFTLASVIDEVLRWSAVGRSCFAELLGQLHLKPPNRSVLDELLPLPAR
ncbi:MAG: IS66 family transposase, partial [Burkholderiales bacterium]